MSVCVVNPPLWLYNIVFSHACACACGAADCASCCARVQPIKVHTGMLAHNLLHSLLSALPSLPFSISAFPRPPPHMTFLHFPCVSYWILAVDHQGFCFCLFYFFCYCKLKQSYFRKQQFLSGKTLDSTEFKSNLKIIHKGKTDFGEHPFLPTFIVHFFK